MRYVNLNITRLTILTSVLLFLSAGLSCTKDKKEYPNPGIELITESGFTYTETTFLLGDTVTLGIIATSNSDVNLTHFNITIDRDSSITKFDTGIYHHQFRYEKKIKKSLARNEKWSFYVTDRDGRKSPVVSVTLLLDSASIFGNIKSIPSVTLGAQSNTTIGSFYSLSFDEVYNLSEAYLKQSQVDLLCYYDFIDGDNNTISSPGANLDPSVFVGPNAPSNWTDINTTRFVFLNNVGAMDFDLSKNDSLILSNSFDFPIGKRKAKNLVKDQIFAFETDKGLKGLFKVLEVTDQDAGTVQIAIKTQAND